MIAKSNDLSEPASDLYALSVTAFGDSICVETAGTRYTAHSRDRNEIREATPYDDPEPWQLFNECWVQVGNRSELLAFLMLGGHGLVARKVISDWWPDFFAPTECFRYCESLPFLGRDYLPPGAEQRHPPPLVRKQVLARDGSRCRVCGYSPDDHPAVKLEIHHVLEQALGGLTVEFNLLTLCKNCHENATRPDPWLRTDLFEKIVVATSRYHRRNHEQGVETYRTWAARALAGGCFVSKVDDPVECLIFDFDDPDDHKRYARWYLAYLRLISNSLVRYFSFNEWRRSLPAELRRR